MARATRSSAAFDGGVIVMSEASHAAPVRSRRTSPTATASCEGSGFPIPCSSDRITWARVSSSRSLYVGSCREERPLTTSGCQAHRMPHGLPSGRSSSRAVRTIPLVLVGAEWPARKSGSRVRGSGRGVQVARRRRRRRRRLLPLVACARATSPVLTARRSCSSELCGSRDREYLGGATLTACHRTASRTCSKSPAMLAGVTAGAVACRHTPPRVSVRVRRPRRYESPSSTNSASAALIALWNSWSVSRASRRSVRSRRSGRWCRRMRRVD